MSYPRWILLAGIGAAILGCELDEVIVPSPSPIVVDDLSTAV